MTDKFIELNIPKEVLELSLDDLIEALDLGDERIESLVDSIVDYYAKSAGDALSEGRDYIDILSFEEEDPEIIKFCIELVFDLLEEELSSEE